MNTTSKDTINLLKDCNSGSKMAVNSIDELMGKTANSELLHKLTECKDRHSKLGNNIHKELNSYSKTDEDVPAMAKAMSWVVTNMKMMTGEHDTTIANIMTDGCNMGIKSLNQSLNKYENANYKSKELCRDLIKLEEDFAVAMREYL